MVRQLILQPSELDPQRRHLLLQRFVIPSYHNFPALLRSHLNSGKHTFPL